MAKAKTYPRSRWITEIPFDVADWGDKPDPWPNGLFPDEKSYREAVRESEKLPKTPAMPRT